MNSQSASQSLSRPVVDALFRWVLLAYLSLLLCPIRYCVPTRANVDNTWFFALNYAAAHHLVFGRDIVWTWGPLAYLLVPFHIGSNLMQGVVFQVTLWIFLIVVLWELLVGAHYSTGNVALFSVFTALTSINYSQELNPGYLLPPLALVLLVHFRLRGGVHRLVAALVLLGLMPLFQCVGLVLVLGIVAGFVVDRLVQRPPNLVRECAIALSVPFVVMAVGGLLFLGSFRNIREYLHSSKELASGYVLAMSLPGTRNQTLFTLLVFALFVAVLLLLHLLERKTAISFSLLFAIPVLFELRHALVREDPSHVSQFFCLVALTFALMALAVPLRRRAALIGSLVLGFALLLLWRGASPEQDRAASVATLTAARGSGAVWEVLHYRVLLRSLQDAARQNAAEDGLEPEIRSIVGQQPVAFLSHVYSSALGDNLDLALLPVPQNYSAYTPYLDGLNAQWIASRGPRFLVYEAIVVDDRLSWIEAPATWAAVYRWYETRWLGRQYLLLQRRAQPRSAAFEPLETRTVAVGEQFSIPQGTDPVFWTMRCSLNWRGKARALFFEVPEVTMTLRLQNGAQRVVRGIVPLLETPSLGNYLPVGLAQVSQVMTKDFTPTFPPRQSLQLGGAGAAAYQDTCRLQFLRALP